jgi:hypothetical protein
MPFFQGFISKFCLKSKVSQGIIRGWHPQPIHGQPDAFLPGLHLKILPKKQSFTRYY